MLLVATALARSCWAHRLRTVAAVLGVTIGVALATGVATASDSVVAGIRGGLAVDAVEADTAALARSGAGIEADVVERVLRSTAPTADSLPVLRADTRLASDKDATLTLLGTTLDAGKFFRGVSIDPTLIIQPQAGTSGIVLVDTWAKAHGLGVGDTLDLVTPNGARAWTVVATAEAPDPAVESVAVAAINDVGEAFGRPGRADMIYFRAHVGQDVARLEQLIRQAVGNSAAVGPIDTLIAPNV
jgi:ABC-type lipoprotein release transport system permease subunit